MTDIWLNQIAEMIKNNTWFAPILALLAGIITSFTPCSLSSIPLVIGYVGGVGKTNTKKAFLYSLMFSVGTAVTFIILGIIATSAGKLMGTSSSSWYLILGILMIMMSLQTMGIINIIPSTNLLSKNNKRGFLGAFTAGVLGGIFSSPCSTPVLIALLAIIAEKSNLIWGILLMILYSIGHSTLVIMAGTSIGFVQKISSNSKYNIAGNILKAIMSLIILIIGLYMFWLAF